MVREHRLIFTNRPDGWEIEGELDRHTVTLLHNWCDGLSAQQQQASLELGGLEILDSEGSAAAVAAIRLLLCRISALTVAHAPHLLAHTLYRIGMLEEGGKLQLIEPREEEPYG